MAPTEKGGKYSRVASSENIPSHYKDVYLSFFFFFAVADLTLLHSEPPKLHRVLAVLSAKGLTIGACWFGYKQTDCIYRTEQNFIRLK